MAPCRPVQEPSPTAKRPGSESARRYQPRSHPSCSARRARPAPIVRGLSPASASEAKTFREGAASIPRRSASRRARRRRACESRIAAVTASRGASSSVKRSPAASSSFAPSPRIASVIRTPSNCSPAARPRSGGTGRTRGRRGRRRRPREHRAGADRAARVGRAAPECRRPAGRQHGRRAPRRPESVTTPWQRSPSLHSASAEVRSRTSIRSSTATIAASFEVISWPVWLPPEWTMRRLACPPSSPSASRPSWSRSKTTPRACRSRTAAGASSTRHPHGRGAAEAAPGGDRVGRVAVGGVAGLQRRGEPALGPEAGALGERRARDEADPAALLGRAQRRPQPGRAAADDGDVELPGRRLSPSPLGGSSPAARAARRRRLRGRAPARRRRRARPRRRGVRPLDPLLRRLGVRLDLARRASAAAIAFSLASRSCCSSSSWAEPQLLALGLGPARARSRSASSASISAWRGARPGRDVGRRFNLRSPLRSAC